MGKTASINICIIGAGGLEQLLAMPYPARISGIKIKAISSRTDKSLREQKNFSGKILPGYCLQK